ncbi:acetoacetate decarboxylase family protein [Rufibacter radiotolerans]|uniref:acetoacetate decarboxylase family protein n=1 Tax=Rufibacter radiotolerans TaxID=1379910 RepID=UPI0006647949|nr:acetoacetate decarboxylase family protein [Rufibacter radiotolerans]
MELVPDIVAPAPWQLEGSGVIWYYPITKAFNQKYGFLAGYQAASYVAGFGAVMYVDYTSSGVGPYQELLYIPGLFKMNGKLTFTISKIYVSTYDSVWNGRENWGILKERAIFNTQPNKTGGLDIGVSREGQTFFEAQVQPKGPKVPLYSWLFSWFRVMQLKGTELLLTKPTLQGHAQWASSKTQSADPRLFPPVQQLKPLMTLYIPDFKMVFPKAQALPYKP